MSFLGTVVSDISKGVSFVLKVFSKTQAVVAVLQKVGPGTVAALLAVFYDVTKFLVAESAGVVAAEGDVKALNFAGALNDVFSDTTKALLHEIVTDFHAADVVVVNDFHELGIAAKSTVPVS